jgi:hypothetical protein
MNQRLHMKTSEQMVEAIFALDLDPIKFKLMDKKEGHGWSRAKVDAVELEYRRFLALTAKYPDQVIAPNTDVDKFWHGHILDTMKYAQDCEHVFGYFLHHFPYFGMRDEEDAANLASAAVNTRKLYELEFGASGKGEASSYCAATTGKEGDAAYCAATAEMKSAYCAATVEQKSAYCAAAGKQAAAYCAATAGKEGDAAYCAATAEMKSAYCAATVEQKSAYCATTQASIHGTPERQQASPSYCAVVTGKGRPKLEPAQAA